MIITIASVFGACKNGSSDLQTNKVMLTDTTGNYSKSISSDTAAEMQKVTKPVGHESNESRSNTTNPSVTARDNSNSSANNENTTTNATVKKKGKGAIIGGLAAVAGGYIIGNEKDKKTGR